MKKIYNVETFVELLFCDKCGKEMKRQPLALLTNPLKFTYKCECGEEIVSMGEYPRIFHIRKEDNNDR